VLAKGRIKLGSRERMSHLYLPYGAASGGISVGSTYVVFLNCDL